MESRSDELYHVLCEKGYPDDFCREIAYRQMNTDYTATRMLGYLYRVSDPRPGGRSRRNARNPDRPRSDYQKERTGARSGNYKSRLSRRTVKI